MTVAFRKTHPDGCTLVFGTFYIDFAVMQVYQLPYQHQAYAAACYFGIDGIAASEMQFEQLFCSRTGTPIPVSLTSIFQLSFVSCTRMATLPFSGVYFKALEMTFSG